MQRLVSLFALIFILLFSCPGFAQEAPDTGQGPPASQSELSKYGNSLKPVMFAPTRGLVTHVTDLARDSSTAAILDNMQMLRKGIWTSRGIGHSKHRASTFNSGADIREIYPYTDSTGTLKLIIQAEGKVYLYDVAATTDTEIATGLNTSIDNQCCFQAHSSDLVILTNGDVNPKKWDGNTANDFVNASGWPATIAGTSYEKPKYNEIFAGRAVWAGFSAHPQTVVFSEQDDPESFTVNSPQQATDAGAITFPATLGKIVGMRTLKLDTTTADTVLLVGCQRGFALITGSSALNFAGLTLTTEFGLASNRTWVQLGNDLFFLASDGIRKFSTASGISTLSNTSVTFGLQDLVNRVNSAQAFQAFAVQHPSTQEVIFYFPIDSDTECKNGIVMNYNTRDKLDTVQETISDPVFSTRSGVSFSAGTQAGGNVYYGNYSGYLFQGYSGDQYDGSDFAWSYVSPLIGANSPAQSCSLRMLQILTDGPDQGFTAQAYTLTQRSDGVTAWTPQDSKTYAVTSPSITQIATWSSGTTTSYPKFHEFQSRGSGRYWAFKISGSSGQHINLVGLMAALTLGGWRQ